MRNWTTMIVVLGLAACASGGSGTQSRRDVITYEQIQSVSVSTAMEVIERLRPEYVRGRGRTSFDGADATLPVVYVDGVRAGGVEALRTISANDVREIRYVNATDATTRYGTGHTGGVIEVRIRS
jgi:hypothetical protein